jgi:selenocysteine lyase/cysteine desulfurase
VLYGKREHLLRLRPYKVRPATEELPGRWMTGTQSHEAMAGVTAAVEYLAELGRIVGGHKDQVGQAGALGHGHDAQPDDSEARESQYDVSDAPTSPGRRQQMLAAMGAIQGYERALSERLVGGLLGIPGLTFYGIRDAGRFGERTPTVSFQLAGLTPRQVAEALGERGIFVWDGNYYALNLSERLGVEEHGGMVRVGLVHYNSAAEVDVLLEALAALSAA